MRQEIQIAQNTFLMRSTALKPFPTHVATRNTYRYHELGMKMHYLAVCYFHPYSTPGGTMKFRVTHSDTFYRFETVSNILIDSENLQSRRISLQITIFDHFPYVQIFRYGRKSRKSQKQIIRFSSSFF